MSDYYSQTMSPVDEVYTLPQCDVSLYNDAGDYTVGSLVWTAKQVENIRARERLVAREFTSTGVPFPIQRHTIQQIEITLDAVWNVAQVLRRNVEYILACTWDNAVVGGAAHYARRVYYGVTTSDRGLQSRDGNEMAGSISLAAKYVEESEGDGEAPAL